MAEGLLEYTGSNIKFNFDKWTVKETENFKFYFQPNTRVSNINEYVHERERAFKKINNVFKAQLPQKIIYFIWNSNEDALKEIDETLGFSLPKAYTIHSLYEQTIGHEMTHVIVGNMDGAIKQTALINEGLAMYFDQTNRDFLTILKESMHKLKGEKISIKDWWIKWPGDMIGDNFYTYVVAAAFVEYLIEEEGMDKMIELAKNQTYQNAKFIYGDKIDQLIVEFENMLNN